MGDVSMFMGFTKPTEESTLESVLRDISSSMYKEPLEAIRRAKNSDAKDTVATLKKQLPAFTPSGTFKARRKMDSFIAYSGYVHLDFDKLSDEQLAKAKEYLKRIPETYAYFVSPSGNGLKVFVKVSTSHEQHVPVYLEVQKYYEKALGLEADPSCKDVTRLCFVSYDPNLYKSESSTVFDFSTSNFTDKTVADAKVVNQTNVSPIESENLVSEFEQCEAITQRKFTYEEGNRNNYVHSLACNCNRVGMPKGDTLNLISTKYNLETDEIKAAVNSAYGNVNEFGIGKYSENIEDIPSSKETPTIQDEVYNNLPDLLKQCVGVFDDERERDVVLSSVISIVSGGLSNVYGAYSGSTVYPNIFSFIIAPAASGKGSMKFARKLGLLYHRNLVDQSKEALREYKASMEVYKMELRAKKKGQKLDEPIKPPFSVFYIPANTSQAKILNHLQDNAGKGVICETEADSMGNALKQDWGGYSDLMRKAFHSEPISYSRKTEGEYISIDEPKLSIAISGTPGQVTNLIHSAEDGLFSRFIYYTFKGAVEWRDVSPKSNAINLDVHFDNLANVFVQLVEHNEIYPLEVTLNDDQWVRLNAFGKSCLKNVTCFNTDQAASIAKRMVLISFKIMLQLTALRRFEDGDTIKKLPCYEIDFKAAVSLAETYLAHSVIMYNNLPKTEEKAFKGSNNIRAFFDSLPDKFQRQQAITTGTAYKKSKRTIDYWLRTLVKAEYLVQPEYGRYEKGETPK